VDDVLDWTGTGLRAHRDLLDMSFGCARIVDGPTPAAIRASRSRGSAFPPMRPVRESRRATRVHADAPARPPPPPW
jgi:hypothetical protein